jgi:hypothetical protein
VELDLCVGGRVSLYWVWTRSPHKSVPTRKNTISRGFRVKVQISGRVRIRVNGNQLFVPTRFDKQDGVFVCPRLCHLQLWLKLLCLVRDSPVCKFRISDASISVLSR